MDVVRRNVEALNGSITVTTRAGEGTRFRIRLPLTLAILDGLATRTGGQTYILPLLSVRQSVCPRPEDVRTVLGGAGELFLLRGEQLPLVRLADVYGITDAERDPTRGIIVVAENDGRVFGLLVDDVVGQQQVVVKNLEKNWKRVESVMGATILGDGRVAFIVDVSELHRVAMRRRGESGERQAVVADESAAVMEEAA
jgi:two-component system chemotaxis sensor kinase CheA